MSAYQSLRTTYDTDGIIASEAYTALSRALEQAGPFAVLGGHTGGILSTVYNQDGTRLLTASYDGTARLWDAKGNLIAVLEGHTGSVNSAVFNQDGTRILTAGRDHTAILWDAEGNLLMVLEGHTGSVNSAVFNQDGTRILTASEDRTVGLWPIPDEMLVEAERRLRLVLSAEACQAYFTDFDPAFCAGWEEDTDS